jgi:hypothetical protein
MGGLPMSRTEDREEEARVPHWCSLCHGHTGANSPCHEPEDEPEEASVTDSELLELAANGAGFEWRWFGATFCTLRDPEMAIYKPWNPLEDDGDAFRLAVRLRFDICTEDNDPHPTEDRNISHVNVWPLNGGIGASEELEPDPYAATRRAVVRAAASMAKEPT